MKILNISQLHHKALNTPQSDHENTNTPQYDNKDTKHSSVKIFSSYLKQLNDDINKRFDDVFQLNVPKWIIDPFEADIFEINVNLQKTFYDLQNDLKLKVIFFKERYESF